MSKNGPNKTVAAARRKMGGFPAHEPRPKDPFFVWFFEQVQKHGRTDFESMDSARAEFERAQNG